jgi:hypothetical protein
MGYIIKNTSGLVNTRITDTGRQKLSQGNFKISYFQVGDSEVSYDKLPSSYNQTNSYVLEPQFNAQNSSGVPQSNKQYVKYPYLVDQGATNTYGIPYMDSSIESVYNRAAMRGFFDGIMSGTPITWRVLTGDYYVVTANYEVPMDQFVGDNKITLEYSPCNPQNTRKPSIGDFITIFYDGNGCSNCYCENLPTPTPTASPNSTPTPTPTPSSTTGTINCASPTPTPTPTHTPCLSPTLGPVCPPTPLPECYVPMSSCYLILTYRIIDVCENLITLDRNTPDYCGISPDCCARVIVYPPNMTTQYDSYTPRPHWADNVIDFESVCDLDQFNVKVWNMNIPWTENPAGLISTQYKGYSNFGSIDYIGSKEYLGYNSSKGQTTTDYVYYYNSFSEKIIVTPEEQKAIAIIHYTNQTIDFFYGEKFALEPYDPTNPLDTTGQARNFKLHIPTLMWHKNRECCFGVTFWVDPPGFEDKDLFKVQYIRSTKNSDMNQPGLRYYNLWDTYKNANGLPSRVGKVFPDSQLIVIDDEEIVAALSYKSNRNFTLPAPQVSLITPNVCDTTNTSEGILTGNSETMYITYQLENDFCFTNWLHSNYYSKIQGNDNNCNPDVSKNVAVRFGPEFPCLTQPGFVPTTTTTTTPTTTTTTTTTLAPPCWENGFNFTFQFGSNDVELFLENTGSYLNGQPVFLGVFGTQTFNVYWNGLAWIIIGIDSPTIETILFTTIDPIGGFDTNVTGGVIQISGYTNCGTTNAVCANICQILGSCYNDTFLPVNSGGTTVYLSFVTNSQIYYEPISGDWAMVIAGVVEGKLNGLSPNDIPIGSYLTNTYFSIDTTPGNCPLTCVCLNFSALTTTELDYLQCNGVITTLTINQGDDIDLCVLNNSFNIGNGSVVLTGCTLDCTIPQIQQTQTTQQQVNQTNNLNINQVNNNSNLLTTTTTYCPVCNIEPGFWATNLKILAQKVATGERPNPEKWKIIDFTSQIESQFINGYVTEESLTGSTFIITPENYNSAPYYNLNDYINLVPVSQTGPSLNFGDEYYFYGNVETDIQATIYEMKYKINLGQTEFLTSQNPSWIPSTPSYITEIGLFDENKDLLVVSKLQSPTLRQGIQQYVVKLDL